MKKVFFTVLFAVGFLFTAEAQNIANNAIGIRVGDNKGFGTEINYQRGLSESTRLEFGLGWRSSRYVDAFKLTGLHQWVWNIEGGFNWYVGVGGGAGSVSYDRREFPDRDRSYGFAFVAGDIGIEYNFDIPLLISLDFRPEVGFGSYRDDLGFDVGLGVRYQF
jgi:opacity protein-like surface antigen